MKVAGRLRAYFLAGVVVTAPIAITVWLVWWIVSLFDTWFKPLIPSAYNPDTYLPFQLPGVGLVVAFVTITVIGALAANLVGRTLLSYWEYILNRMPVVRSIYRAVKQIFQTALSQTSSSFRQVGLIHFLGTGAYVVVFVARELDSGEIGLAPGRRMVSAFMPTTPNPTSGFLFFLPREDVTILDLTVEEAAKLVVSAGLVTPDRLPGLPGVAAIDKTLAEGLIKSNNRKPAKPARRPANTRSARKKPKAVSTRAGPS